MLEAVEGEGRFVVFGGEEHHGVAAERGFAAFLFLVLVAVGTDYGFAVAAVAVEGGVDDDRQVFHRYGFGVEGCAQGVDGEALVGQAACLFFAEDDVVVDGVGLFLLFLASEEGASAALAGLEGVDVLGVDAVGEEVGHVVEVGEAVAGIVDDEFRHGLCLFTALAGNGMCQVLKPVDALLLDVRLGGVLEQFHLPLGYAEGFHEVGFCHFAVVLRKGHVGNQFGIVVLVGYDEDVGVGAAVGRYGDVHIHEVVLHPLTLHAFHGFVEDVVDAHLDARAAVVVRVDGVFVRLRYVAVVVVGLSQGGDVLLEEGANALGAEVGQLAVVVDACCAVHRQPQPLAVEDHRAIAEVAVAAVVGYGCGEFRTVGRGGDDDFDLFAGFEDVRQRVLHESAGEVADGAAGVRRVHVVRPQGVVVCPALEVLAVVAQAVHKVQSHAAVVVEGVDQVCHDGDIAFVVELFVVGQSDQCLLGIALHVALTFEHHLRQRIADLILVAPVQQPFAHLGLQRQQQRDHRHQQYNLFHSISIFYKSG